MTLPDPRIPDLLEAMRDLAVGELLEALARGLETGAQVVNEPILRGANGQIRREGALMLPRRGDLAVTRDKRRMIVKVECRKTLPFPSALIPVTEGVETVIAPFRWEAAEIVAEQRMGKPDPDWKPLRHWFLEWFQSRYSDEAPDLDGAVHALTGPERRGADWRFVVDFGSAPAEVVLAMVVAFGETGCHRLRIGSEVAS